MGVKIDIVTFRLPTNTPNPSRHSTCGWVALVDGKEVGWCNMAFWPDKVIKFEDAFVKEKYRGKGIYKTLWNTRWEYVSEHYKGYRIVSYCKPTTLEFHKKKGFETKEILELMEKIV